MPIDREDLRRSLEKKGFHRKDTDHDFYHLQVDGKKVGVFTKLSRAPGYKTYSDSLVGEVAKQLGLTKKELLQFVECPLSHDDHVKILKARKRIRGVDPPC